MSVWRGGTVELKLTFFDKSKYICEVPQHKAVTVSVTLMNSPVDASLLSLRVVPPS